jgi:hypothetical protein
MCLHLTEVHGLDGLRGLAAYQVTSRMKRSLAPSPEEQPKRKRLLLPATAGTEAELKRENIDFASFDNDPAFGVALKSTPYPLELESLVEGDKCFAGDLDIGLSAPLDTGLGLYSCDFSTGIDEANNLALSFWSPSMENFLSTWTEAPYSGPW